MLELPPAPSGEVYVRRYDTDHVWMVWRYKDGGTSLFLERPFGEFREGVTVSLQWHQSPDPEVVAAMVRAYARRGRPGRRPSLWARLLRR
ncbi:hypothetical protein ACW4TU_41515 [Streptomyces sp. QTS52]